MEMLLSRRLGSLVAAALVVSAFELWRRERTPAAAQNAAPVASARIIGRITAAEDSRPIADVNVRVTIIGPPQIRQAVSTDADGRFEVAHLPAGSYVVDARKDGFVSPTDALALPDRVTRRVVLGNGQVSDVNLLLSHGAVIAGRIVDRRGRSIGSVRVQMLTKDLASGQFSVYTGHAGITDTAGEFRLNGLPSGRYYLCATSPPSGAHPALSEYATTCYNGTANVADAQAIILGRAETRDVRFVMQPAIRTATVSGTVVDANTRPVTQGRVLLTSRTALPPRLEAPIQSNGTFTVSGVLRGEYVLTALPSSPLEIPTSTYRPVLSVAAVTVTGSDVKSVVMEPVKAVTVSGRLIVPPQSAASLQTRFIRIGTVPMASPPLVAAPPPAAVVNPDRTFQFTTPALPMFIQVLGAGPLIEKAVRIGERDFIDTPVDFQPGHDVANVEVVMMESPALTATITVAGGGIPKEPFYLIVFPQDRNKWTEPFFHGRFAELSLDAGTTFAIRTLRPGQYYAVAVDRVDNRWRDADFLDSLRPSAVPFELREAEHKTLTLRLTTSP